MAKNVVGKIKKTLSKINGGGQVQVSLSRTCQRTESATPVEFNKSAIGPTEEESEKLALKRLKGDLWYKSFF